MTVNGRRWQMVEVDEDHLAAELARLRHDGARRIFATTARGNVLFSVPTDDGAPKTSSLGAKPGELVRLIFEGQPRTLGSDNPAEAQSAQ